MTVLDTDYAHSGGWLLARAMQVLLALIVGYAVLSGQLRLLVNSAIPFSITLLPSLLRREYDYEMGGGLAAWIGVAAALHAVGVLELYTTVAWFDQVAHTVSASLVAGAGYAIVIAIENQHDGVVIPERLRAVFILLFVLAFGVLWEIAEFATEGLAVVIGGTPVLVQYGSTDIVLDLLFNAVGAILVAIWGTGYFEEVSRLLAERAGWTDGES